MLQSLKLLLVDDDVTDRMSIKRMLGGTDADLEIEEAVDVSSAHRALKGNEFDVALVDFRLPDGTAFDVLKHMDASPGGQPIPVIILTGLDDKKTTRDALRHGAQDYLVKGEFDRDLLWRSIGYAVERKRGENLRRQLMHADRMAAIGQLSAGVAHEINSPATFIISNLAMIREILADLRDEMTEIVNEDAAPEDRERAIDEMFDEALDMIEDNLQGMERISSVVRDLGVFSRLDDDEVEMVDVNQVIEGAIKLVHNQIRHRAQLVKDLGDLPPVAASPGRLGQVFTNLLMNAAQAIEEGHTDENEIRITSRPLDDHIELLIEDTGVGIPPEVLRRVFDPFFTTKGRGEGTGLGLAICTQIIEAHNGEITVTSAAGEGTTVRVLIPLDTGFFVQDHSEVEDEEEEGRRLRPRVLIVDDEEMMLKSFRRALEPHYDVVTKTDGQQVLDLFQHDTDFDVIVCDVMMPRVDGVTVYREIKSRLPHLLDRIVFLSGGVFTDRTKDFLSSVNHPVLEKPIDPAELARAIDEMCSTVES